MSSSNHLGVSGSFGESRQRSDYTRTDSGSSSGSSLSLEDPFVRNFFGYRRQHTPMPPLSIGNPAPRNEESYLSIVARNAGAEFNNVFQVEGLPHIIRGSASRSGDMGEAGRIYSAEDAKWLSSQGVKLLISFNEYECISSEALRDQGISFHQYMTEDYDCPTAEHIQAAISIIDQTLSHNADAKVYVHCGAGLGRTGAFITAYQIHKRLITNQDELSQKITDNYVERSGQKQYLRSLLPPREGGEINIHGLI